MLGFPVLGPTYVAGSYIRISCEYSCGGGGFNFFKIFTIRRKKNRFVLNLGFAFSYGEKEKNSRY